MDTSKFLGKFRDATRDHAARMNELLLRLEEEPGRPDDVAELMREIHTLKGEARMMGFGDIAEIAHAVEEVLRVQEQDGFREIGLATDALFRAFDVMERLVAEKLGLGSADVDVVAERDSLLALAGVDAPTAPAVALPATVAPPAVVVPPEVPPEEVVAREALPEVPQEESDEGRGLGDLELPPDDDDEEEWELPDENGDSAADLREAFGVPQGLAQEIGEGGVAAPPGERAVSIGAGQARFVARLRDAAEGRLERASRALSDVEGESASPGSLLAVAGDMGELGREARALGRDAVADLALALESRLRALPAADAPDMPRRPALLREALDALGRLLAEALGGPAAGVNVADLVARLGAAAPAQHATVAPRAPVPELPSVMPAPKTAVRTHAVTETIRVPLDKLDALASLSGDLFLGQARAEERHGRLHALLDLASRHVRAANALRRTASMSGRVGPSSAGLGALHEAFEDLTATARSLRKSLLDATRAEREETLRSSHAVLELSDRVKELQLLPMSTLFDEHPRLVRDLSRELGRQARVVVVGGDVEIDRRVLEDLRDPMLHLVRNAVDHGIEPPAERLAAGKSAQGTIRLSARAEGDRVVLEIADDGAGIDAMAIRRAAVRRGLLEEDEAEALSDEQAINLVFRTGFSSREIVSEISGRGVGLDVVRDRVDRLDGSLRVASEPGAGTRFILRLPLTLAMARVLLLRAADLLVAMPAALVEDVLRVEPDDIRSLEGYKALEWRGRSLPLASLASLLDREDSEESAPAQAVGRGRRGVVVVGFEEHVVAFAVDGFEGEKEVVVKPLDAFLGRIPNVVGATVLGSGRIVLVLHVPQLVASTLGVSPIRLHPRSAAAEGPISRRPTRVLVVDDSIIVRDIMKGVLEAAGFDVTLAVDGLDGLEKQLADPHDLVITDVEMPRMDGFDLTRSLKQDERGARVPVIVVTTLDSEESRRRGLEAGASAYVVKNLLDMSQLVGVIERLIA